MTQNLVHRRTPVILWTVSSDSDSGSRADACEPESEPAVSVHRRALLNKTCNFN